MRDSILYKDYRGANLGKVALTIEDTETLGELNSFLAERWFDPFGRDRKVEALQQDLNGSEDKIRLYVYKFEAIEPSDEYVSLQPDGIIETPIIPSELPHKESIERQLKDSLAVAEILMRASGKNDETNKIRANEWILWHGTSHESKDSLVRTQPESHGRAYGHGFYLAPFWGKADQYADLDSQKPYFAMIGYRVLPGHVEFNPHRKNNQDLVETNHYTSYISLGRSGQQELKFHEVVLRNVVSCTPFCILYYDRYQNRVGLPTP